FGVKPLYYYSGNGDFIFASEIKAILKYTSIIKKPNIEYLKNYLKYGPKEYIKETAFEGIYHFDFAHYFEGHISELFNSKTFKLQKYWQIHFNLETNALQKQKLFEYKKQYHALLKDAVKLRLRSDAKIGLSLSGGLDSTSILY